MNQLIHKKIMSILIIILLSITHNKSLLSQQETFTMPLIDDRAVSYYEPNNHYDSYGFAIVGSDIDGVIFRGSSMWGPDPVGDWAFNIYSGKIHLNTVFTPSANYNVYMRQINSDPRSQSNSSLYGDIGNGTIYRTYTIPEGGINQYENLSSSYCDYIENNLSNDWVAGGFQAASETNGINSTLYMQNLKVVVEYLITTSGTLSNNEKWQGTVNLTGNVVVPSGKTLLIDDATVNLNGYYLKSTGGTITNNGTVNPDVQVEQSGTIKGYYPSISSAASNAVSGQTIRVASGTYNENSITVPSGILLDIYTDNPSVIINFSSGSNLTVNGELKANDVTFKGQGSGTSYWSGIYVNRKAIITYSNIRNASYGVKTTSCLSSTTISYNEFRDCTNGIVCYSGGSPTINSNDFYNIQNAAIALNSTPANANYNDVFQSNQSSVLMTSITTSGDFNHNRIFSSGLHGIWIGGYSNIQIENCSIERCNNGACVNITSTATPSVTPGNTIERFGYWSIYNGNANHCVNALNNTWVNMLNYGCVDTDDKDLPDKGDDGKDLFALGTDYYDNGKHERALGIFKNLILDYSDSDYARDALTYIMRIFESKAKPDGESIHYFKDLKRDLSAKGVQNLMSSFVDLHILYWLQRNDLFDETEKKYDELLATLTEDEFQTELKFGKAVFYIYEKNEPEKAAPLLADVAKSKSILSGMAQMELADIGGQPYASSGDPELPGSALISNFPNPFNPDTHIKYRINNPSSVQIVVYDILGRKIRTLVDNYQSAGIHDVRWDGTDYNGVNVASGMYFYKLICNDFVDVKKMLLLR